jgi:hypothetical protein
MRGERQWDMGKRVLEDDRVSSQSVQVRRFNKTVSIGRKVIRPKRVDRDDENGSVRENFRPSGTGHQHQQAGRHGAGGA